MKIIFRVDASVEMGTGHVMRCLTLADEMRQRGADVIFVCREHPGHMIDLIEDKGYPVVRLRQSKVEYTTKPDDVAHAAWLGVPWRQDAVDTRSALGKICADWLIIDHYAIDRRWEAMLRPYAEKVMVFDDLADRPHDCDVLLDQNLYEDMENRYNSLVSDNCIKLFGPQYALLRPEFVAARKNLRQRDGQVRRVLVFFGGVDPTNETEKALQALAGIAGRQFEIDVVVGGENPHKEYIQNLCVAHGGFHYYCQVDNMAELMAAADLAIGAGGSTTWERCSLGLPSFVIALAVNQVNIARSADKAGVLKYLGELSTVSFKELSHQISAVYDSGIILNEMSKKAQQLVDGYGAIRVADKMEHQ